jgi:drug/metabolite transporter (DMT)-like permease
MDSSVQWLAPALISALTLAGADVATKRYFGAGHGWDLVLVRLAVPGLFLLPYAIAHPIPRVPGVFWGWMALLAPLEIAGMLLYALAIRDSPLRLTLPYLAFTPVFNLIGGYLLLGETVSGQGLAGIVCVVLGAYVLNANNFSLRTPWGWAAPLRAIADERGSRRMLAAALIYSFTSVGSKYAMGYATPESFGAFYFVIVGFLTIAITLLYRPRQLWSMTRRPGGQALIGILSAVMVITHFLALARVQVAYYIAVKRTSLLFGMVLGAVFLGERFAPRHLLAATVMLAGVVLIV